MDFVREVAGYRMTGHNHIEDIIREYVGISVMDIVQKHKQLRQNIAKTLVRMPKTKRRRQKCLQETTLIPDLRFSWR
jgi:hypothetical protein